MRLRRAAAMTLDWDSDSTKEAREEGSAAADPLRLRFRFFWRLIANEEAIHCSYLGQAARLFLASLFAFHDEGHGIGAGGHFKFVGGRIG